jgi:hypothetical protein
MMNHIGTMKKHKRKKNRRGFFFFLIFCLNPVYFLLLVSVLARLTGWLICVKFWQGFNIYIYMK